MSAVRGLEKWVDKAHSRGPGNGSGSLMWTKWKIIP